MIICHPKRLIFIKTKKVGGTSFEIALSKFCGPDCVITPLVWRDHKLRESLGIRGAQNCERPLWPDGSRAAAVFEAHSTAAEVKAAIPADIWAGYRQADDLARPVRRDDLALLLARRAPRGRGLRDFVLANPDLVSVNTAVAPLAGPARLDIYLRYERLEADMAAAGLGDVWAVMKGLSAKGGKRPPEATVAQVYAGAPKAAALVAELCAEEIAAFGYEVPG